jgi:hypothetical protein
VKIIQASRDNLPRFSALDFLEKFSKNKVVDKKGLPKVVYHGSFQKFLSFKRSEAYFFSESEEVAKGFGSYVYPCYIHIEDPLEVILNPDDLNSLADYVPIAKNKSCDGIIARNFPFGLNEEEYPSLYVVFNTNQIQIIKD